jgi:hypothetical protein
MRGEEEKWTEKERDSRGNQKDAKRRNHKNGAIYHHGMKSDIICNDRMASSGLPLHDLHPIGTHSPGWPVSWGEQP